MNAFIKERTQIENAFATLMSLPEDKRSAEIKRIQEEAEAASKFKKGQMVRACQSPGFSLVTMDSLPHNHNDPEQHFNSRVLGWDCFGRIDIAIGYGTNPHCSNWCWSDDALTPLEEEDWVVKSLFKPNMHVVFDWDLPGFGEEFGANGRVVPAILIAPHIKEGDWFVLYQKASGGWITRVVNERILRIF